MSIKMEDGSLQTYKAAPKGTTKRGVPSVGSGLSKEASSSRGDFCVGWWKTALYRLTRRPRRELQSVERLRDG